MICMMAPCRAKSTCTKSNMPSSCTLSAVPAEISEADLVSAQASKRRTSCLPWLRWHRARSRQIWNASGVTPASSAFW